MRWRVCLLLCAIRSISVAIRAAESLALTGDPRAVEPLMGVLKTAGDVWTRASVAKALGMLKDNRAIEPLIETLKEVRSYSAARMDVERALKELSGQDFGEDAEKWKGWWEQSRTTRP